MLFDTDVLIWCFRGSEKAARLIERADERLLSVVSYMELLQGALNKTESRAITSFLADFAFRLLPLTENIGHRAAIYMEEHGLGGGMCMADALLAATAVENRVQFCTGNVKHYRVIVELEIAAFKP
jgi:hypothetical protein